MSKNIKYFNNRSTKYTISSSKLIILLALFLIAFDNVAFFSNVFTIYPVNLKNLGFLVSLTWGFTAAIVILLALVCYRYTLNP